tara:strand:- start:291 stop:800 length:510 start_codon:yes stop_codon:yes gene_type:complete
MAFSFFGSKAPLRVDILGIKGKTVLMGVMARKVKNLKPAFEDIADDFYRNEREMFARSGAVGGGFRRWKPVNATYARRKAEQGFGSKILVRTGRLRSSLTSRGGDNHLKIGKLQMSIGTTVPYAKYHEHGTRKMPKRSILRIPKKTRAHWVRIIQRHIIKTGQFKRANL